MQPKKNPEILKFQDLNIWPNNLHVDADADVDAGGLAIALLHWSAVTLKRGKRILITVYSPEPEKFGQYSSHNAVDGNKQPLLPIRPLECLRSAVVKYEKPRPQ